MRTEKYLKEVWRIFECTPPQIQNIMVNFGIKSSLYCPARKKKLNYSAGKWIPCDTLDVANTFNNYLREAVVNKGVERVIDDLEITQASNPSLREAINCVSISIQLYCEQELHERYLRQAKSTEGSWLWINSQRLLRLSASPMTHCWPNWSIILSLTGYGLWYGQVATLLQYL